MGKPVVERMHPVGIKECGRRGTVGERETVAHRPFAIRHARVEPGVAGVEHGACLFDTLYVASFGIAQAITDDLLQRGVKVIVEEPVHQPHFEPQIRVAGEHRLPSRIVSVEIFDDDAGLGQGEPARLLD